MQRTLFLWFALLAVGLGLRLLFVFHQPFTNDEGSYLYDAVTLLAGRLPAGDVLTKAPAVVGLFAASVWLTDGSLFAARFVSALFSMFTVVPLAALATWLNGAATGRVTRIFWLLAAGPVVFATFGHTETVAIFFGTTALTIWVFALRRVAGRTSWKVAVVAGMCAALAFASRKTSVALLAPAFLLLLRFGLAGRARRRVLWAAAGGALLVFIPWLIFVGLVYGTIGVREALGIGYAGIIAGHVASSEIVRSWVGGPGWALGIAGWTLGPLLLAAGFGLLSHRARRSLTAPAVSVPLSWGVALGALYALWPTLLPDYLSDFLPPLVLLASVGAIRAWHALSRPGRLVVLTLVALWNVVILTRVYYTPWIGMFTRAAVETAAAEAQRLVPPDEPLFTAALLVPYLSGHRVPFDIAHPFWYCYAFIPPAVHQTFLPALAEVEHAVRTRVRWALVEQFTDYVYLRHPSDLLSFIWREFTFVREIPNNTGYRNNPLFLWKRQLK